MKFFFAGAESFEDLLAESGSDQWLVSYFNFKNLDKIKDKKVFLDSGAFTAWSKGKVIDIDKYGEYLKEHGHKFTVYANLDVIGNEIDTLTNQKYLEETYKVKPLPTIHYGADLETLEMYAKEYDYIALGGLVPYAKEPILLRNWLNKCFKILYPFIKNKGLKVHGFGVGSAEILKKYPFYSADSSGWLSGGKFGTVVTWVPEKMKMKSGSHFKDPKTYTERGGNLDLMGHYDNRLKHNIREYMKMEKDITELWKARGITYET